MKTKFTLTRLSNANFLATSMLVVLDLSLALKPMGKIFSYISSKKLYNVMFYTWVYQPTGVLAGAGAREEGVLAYNMV